ncbi:hypothetical protein SOP56_10575 [Weissella confusa]|uniref:hypothetical protein n=1 Tax=Weissella confusa TaxID=1583 RepID=UPI002A75897F|nr:hypothetical protein [Weissella confusa]MDY2530272.1 hypothetical protein [Weissella confusa]
MKPDKSAKNVLKKYIDSLVAIILTSGLFFLWLNGNHIPPREQRYNEAVLKVNTYVESRVLYSQQWLADYYVKQLNASDDFNNLRWNVSSSPEKAIEWTLNNDATAKKMIQSKIDEFNAWKRRNHYSKKEIAKFEVKVYKLSKTEQAQMQIQLKKIKKSYNQSASRRITQLKAERHERELEESRKRAASISAAAESIAAQSIAAERARQSSLMSQARSVSNSSVATTSRASTEESVTSTPIWSQSSSIASENSESSSDSNSSQTEDSAVSSSTEQEAGENLSQ